MTADEATQSDSAMREQRQHRRFTCAGTAEVDFQMMGRSYPARIEDLSLTGCKLVLVGDAELPLRQIFELTFTVKRRPFRVRARATGMRGPGRVGVQFMGLSLITTQNLHDLFDQLAAQASTAKAQIAAQPATILSRG
jgi:hypothetical protein